jgi:dTDP-glucose 4,6-dehydratase
VARVVVTGGAGFLGSHLCEMLLGRGDEVVAVDNLCTSDGSNLGLLRDRAGFSFIEADVCEPLRVDGPVDVVAHLASPASPPDYHALPLETLAVGSKGTEQCLLLAERKDARFVLASTSEVYGDALVNPQSESYFGNVDPVGPRSVYDEAKRFAEALTIAHVRAKRVDAGIVRIFNTYGPRLRPGDGRVVSNFLVQALTGLPLTIYGDGTHTRSFCYVDDLVSGLCQMIDARGVAGPVNLGNPGEMTVNELAQRVIRHVGSTAGILYEAASPGDPARRCPDITLASKVLGWAPAVTLDDGLARTAAWFRERLSARPGE